MVKEDLKRVGYFFILNKLLIVFLVWLTRDVLHPILPATGGGRHHNVVFDSLTHWDAGWFLRIAERGYDFHSAPFFPMMPLLIKTFGYVTGDLVTAGFLVSNAALFIASYLFYRLVRDEHGDKIAATALFIMLFFPTAIFYSSIYSEAPFMAFVLGSFYFARRQKWMPAVLLGACAALTRNIGVVVFLALLYMQYEQNGNKIDLRKALPLLLIPASLLIFMGVLWARTGDPLAFANSLNTEYWSYRTFKYPGAGQLANLQHFYYNNSFYALFESSMAFLFLFVIIRSFAYMKDRVLLLYLVLGFLVPFSSVVNGTPLGMPRYIIVLFPAFITLALALHKHRLVRAYSVITVLVFSVACIMFAAGRWIS